ncbi:MAG TPA: glycosyltransferase family 4 protein [Candidatus Limnocylindrales bacterium]|nr:glycosyltransferase family 4 protein [Candidatus Limnocylindrales bacterium]
MKIGLVTPYIFPVPGGVNAHVRYLYENLVKRGHDVRIISSTHGPQRSSEGDVIRLGYGWSVPTNGSIGTLTVSHRYGQLVTEMLDRERFDVIHFHEPFVPFLSLQVLRHSTSINIATFHAYSGFSPSYEFGQRMMKRFAKKLHGRIAVSAAARHFIGRFFPGEYKVIPNGVDLAQYDDVPPFARWRDGIPNILFVGRLESRKGLMYLLRAYYQLRLEGLGCRLLVVGHGPQVGEARRYIGSRRLGGVELLGRLSEHDKARAFATADIYASPATGQESFGIVLLEAMAAGVPIVCSDIHGYKGVVRRNEQAVLVPPRDVEGLAAALGILLRDPLQRRRMGEAGRARAQQFGWEAVTARVEDYYGFVVRRLAASGSLPPGFTAAVPEAPARSPVSPGLWSSQSGAHEEGGPAAP